ncbi:MAG TPA: ABC transporter substrate-binding protein, partial [Methylomirabilota bacterium]|nr:ABC transporter substrate-binding protein [Methylomirabilota bacterium]
MRRFRPGALLLLATLAAGCGTDAGGAGEETSGVSGGGQPVYGDTFVEATIGDISSLIPNITTDGASHEIGSLIYAGLVTRDRDLNIVPEMAESWQFSQDCLTLTFKLRPNVRWHDGQPFTADDVVFTYRTMLDPKTPTAYREDFKVVGDIEAVDP